MISYIAIGFMKIYAMAKPLIYKSYFTIKSTKKLIALRHYINDLI